MITTVSVGELRQNPTAALDEVQGGATVVVLRHNRPIADLVPHATRAGVSGPEAMTRLRAVRVDLDLASDIELARRTDDRDPWS